MTNIRGRDAGSFVEAAQAAVNKQVKLPPRYSMEWGGQFQNLQQATARLSIVVPVTLAIIFMLLYLLFDSVLIGAFVSIGFQKGPRLGVQKEPLGSILLFGSGVPSFRPGPCMR